MQATDSIIAALSSIFASAGIGTAGIRQFIDTMNGGGILMWILFGLGLILWYALAARLILLGIGGSTINKNTLASRAISKRAVNNADSDNPPVASIAYGVIGRAHRDAMTARARAAQSGANVRQFVSASIMGHKIRLQRYSTLIKTIVIIAPLIGLLGTVIGMIETFEALQTLAVFSQGSSIAGGVSKALNTTQMGLVVGVPGLLIGRMLDRKQTRLNGELAQLNAIVCSMSKANAPAGGL